MSILLKLVTTGLSSKAESLVNGRLIVKNLTKINYCTIKQPNLCYLTFIRIKEAIFLKKNLFQFIRNNYGSTAEDKFHAPADQSKIFMAEDSI